MTCRVFVHRYRDHDPGIRAECVQAMGVWLKRHPAYFLEGSYLRYVGWVLSDAVSSHVYMCQTSLISMLGHPCSPRGR
jgi:cohesin complex subunit SA-1/2